MASLWLGGGLCCSCVVAVLKYLRHPRRPVIVNCHFCNTDHKVPNEKSNSFDCPACGQYNGFTVDGDYNRPLDLSARGTQRYARGSPAVNGSPRENGLCRHCNLNQELKVAQLSSFPSVGEELEDYRAHLERVYRLCPDCEETLAVRLAAQDAKLAPSLIAYRLESSRCNQTATQELLPSSPRTGRLPLVAALLLWLVMAWPLAAQALQLIIPTTSGNSGGQYPPPSGGILPTTYQELVHVFTSLLLPHLPLLLSCLLPLLTLLCHTPSSHALSLLCLLPAISLGLHPLVQLAMCSLVCLVLALQQSPIVVGPNRQLNSTAAPVRDHYSDKFIAALNCPLDGQQEQQHKPEETLTHEQDVEEEEEVASLRQGRSATSSLLTSSLRIAERSPRAGGGGRGRTQLAPRLSSPLLRSGPGDSFNHEFAIQQDNSGGGGRDCDISSLSIADEEEEERRRRSSSGSPFSPRLYSPENNTGIRFSARPPLLRPSRLTSWVAGGYWGSPAATPGDTGQMAASLSRASSQSSGFASASVPSLNICSTFPPQQFVSLPNSIAGGGGSLCGGDRYSVLSEPIFSTRSQVATCQLRPASPFLRQSPLCGTALADSAVQCSRAAPLAYRRPTLEDDLSDSSAGEELARLRRSRAESPLLVSVTPEPSAAPPRRRWSKTISFELTPERIFMACSFALNLAVVSYYLCSV